MELNLGRIGYLLSDRLVINPDRSSEPISLRIASSTFEWFMRILSWICTPKHYTEENRKTVGAFKTYLIEALGAERLQRISSRYGVDLDQMERKGSPLLSRTVAQILVGAKDVRVEDIDQLLRLAHQDIAHWPQWIPPEIRRKLIPFEYSEQLDKALFSELYQILSRPILAEMRIPEVEAPLSSSTEELLAQLVFDPLCADRERQHLLRGHQKDSFEHYVHNMVARVIKREMDVGMYVPAPSAEDGTPRFYRLAAKLVTGKGMVSYVFEPATRDSALPGVRFNRGSAFRSGEVDGISTLITDLEHTIGYSAYLSGRPYAPQMQEKTPYTVIVGHSLGSVLGQQELVENPLLEEAYLYNGPGITEAEVEAFNERMRTADKPLKLVIRVVNQDLVSSLGRVHIGYRAPREKVTVDYLRYFPPHRLAASVFSHVHVWPKNEEAYYGIEGGHDPETIDQYLYLNDRTEEKIRRAIGPMISLVVRVARDMIYRTCNHRDLQEIGLQLGFYEEGHYRFSRIRLS